MQEPRAQKSPVFGLIANAVILKAFTLFNYFVLHVWVPGTQGCPGTEVIDSFELPSGCWELNPDPLEEPLLLLTTQPSFQPCI